MLNPDQLACLTGPNLINDAQLSSEEDDPVLHEQPTAPPVKKEEEQKHNLAEKVSDLVSEFESQQPQFNSDFINYISRESLQTVGRVTKIYGDKYLLQADLDSLKKVGILDLNNFVFVLRSNIPALLGYVSDVLGQIQNPLYEIQSHSAAQVEVQVDMEVYISMMKIKTISMQEIMEHRGRDYELDQHGNIVTAEFESDEELSNTKASEKKKSKKKKNKSNQEQKKQMHSQIDYYAQYQNQEPVPTFNQPYGFNPQHTIPQVPFTAYAPSAYHVMSAPTAYQSNSIGQPNHPMPHMNPSLPLPPGHQPPPPPAQIAYPYDMSQYWGPYYAKKE